MEKSFLKDFLVFFWIFFWNFEFFVDFLQFLRGRVEQVEHKSDMVGHQALIIWRHNRTIEWCWLDDEWICGKMHGWGRDEKFWKCVGVKMNGVNKGSSISSSMLMELFENESVRKRCSDAMSHTLWVMLSKNLVFNLALHVVLNILGVWTSFVLLEVEDG